MNNETLEELKQRITALKLPDVSVEEVLTLVREPLAHVAFKQEGGLVRVWTPACCFVLNLETLRMSVAVPETVGLMQAGRLIRESSALQPVARRSRRAERGRDESLQAPTVRRAAPDPAPTTEGLAEDKGTVQGEGGAA